MADSIEAKRGNLMRDLIGPAALAGPQSGAEAAATKVLQVQLELLEDNPFQPRLRMDEVALKELCASIQEHGLLQPITVRRKGDRFQVVAGHRRAEAFRRLLAVAETDDARRRYVAIPAQERVASEEQMAVFALVENMQRADLSPLDAAAGLARLQELNPELKGAREIAAATGLQADKVKRLLRLNEAPSVVKEGVSGVRVTVQGGAEGEGGERKERRSLELLSALEFRRLHEFLLKRATANLSVDEDAGKWRRASQQVDERVRRAVERALEGGWGLRRIEGYVEKLMEGRDAEAEAEAVAAPPERATPAAFARSEKQLVVHLRRLEGMAEEERVALRTAMEPIWRMVERA